MSEWGPLNLQTFNLNVHQASDKELADTLKNLETRLHEAYREVSAFSNDILKIRREQGFREQMAEDERKEDLQEGSEG